MSTSLAEDLREGRRQSSGGAPPEWSPSPPRARDTLNAGRRRCGRSVRVAEAIARYRQGPRQLWASILLDLLAPAIIHCVTRLRPMPPVLDEDEIRQQFLVELLEAAASIPLPSVPAWQKRAILSRANQAVRRSLTREAMRQGRQRSYEAMVEGEE
jgi:hypothetical protein